RRRSRLSASAQSSAPPQADAHRQRLLWQIQTRFPLWYAQLAIAGRTQPVLLVGWLGGQVQQRQKLLSHRHESAPYLQTCPSDLHMSVPGSGCDDGQLPPAPPAPLLPPVVPLEPPLPVTPLDPPLPVTPLEPPFPVTPLE